MNIATVNPEFSHRLSINGRDLGQFTNDELWQLRVAIDGALTGVQAYEEWQLILTTVCRVSGFSWEEMTSKCRMGRLAYARQIAMAIIYERTGMSLNQVGSKFGGRDHGTVLWAIKIVQGRRGTSDGKLIRLVEAALDDECNYPSKNL